LELTAVDAKVDKIDNVDSDILRALTIVDESGVRGTRLVDDALRLWKRVGRLGAMGLGSSQMDRPALELACFALQLPLIPAKPSKNSRPLAPPSARQPATNLRERAEQAAELLLSGFVQTYDAKLLERTARILRELPRKRPTSEEACLLGDALNLDDFGLLGCTLQAMQQGRANGSVAQLIDAFEKRDQYGYWDMRLKDGFSYDAVRDLARRRLAETREVVQRLAEELKEDELQP